MGERLKQPPLVEAICEFRIAEQEAWDWTVPGRLYERIQAEFPVRTQVQGMGVRVEQNAVQPSVQIVQAGPERIQLKRADGSALVQVGLHLLTINHLKPYPSWEEFLALIRRVLHAYWEVSPNASFERIGLRYVNHIRLEEGKNDIGAYLTVVPALPASLSRPIRSFYHRYELEQQDPSGLLIHQTGAQILPEEQPVFVLDLDFISDQVNHLQEPTTVTDWLNKVHDCVYTAFVDSLHPDLLHRLKTGDL
jgi:uncharacterized protein (TIGR04255 family)